MELEACKILNNINILQAKWWRRGESNPRPKALCHWYYMLSFVIGFSLPKQDEHRQGQRSQFNLTIGCQGSSDCDPVAVAPGLKHRHN